MVLVWAPLLRGFHGDLGGELIELLMRPDCSRRTSLNGTGSAAQNSRHGLLGLVGLSRRHGIQPALAPKLPPRQKIEAGHGLRKRQRPKQRAGRRACGNAGVGAVDEWVQAVDRQQ